MKTPSDESLSQTALLRSLPHPNTKRWVVRRKAAVVAAVRSGAITIQEACRLYQLSEEELLSWQRAFEIHGLVGLRTTRIQQYRPSRSARTPSASRKKPAEPNSRQATPSEVS
jgi:transposase-like protein